MLVLSVCLRLSYLPGLNTDMLTDFILCVISIAIATLFHPVIIAIRLWPYILLLASFAGFVIWNGGVVLGTHSLSSV